VRPSVRYGILTVLWLNALTLVALVAAHR